MFSSSYFWDLYLRDPIDLHRQKGLLAQQLGDKTKLVSSLSGFSIWLLPWSIKLSWDNLISQDNLLFYDEITLPRLVNLRFNLLEHLSSIYKKTEIFDQDFLSFFSYVIASPLGQENLSLNSQQKKDLEKKSLVDYFWLSCLESEKRWSFVCNKYLDDFFENVYVLPLLAFNSENTQETTPWFEQFSSLYKTNNFETYFSLDEYFELYKKLNSDYSFSQKFCSTSLLYLKYWWETDSRFDDLFRNCGEDQYKEYVFLRDFMKLIRGLSLGYTDSTSYSSSDLNRYKLYSLQQLLYRLIQTEEKIVVPFQTYLSFLQEILQKESRSKTELLDSFSKQFSHWFNMKILSPYLREHSDKLTSEERSALMTKLLLLSNGDSAKNMKGLLDKTAVSKENIASQEKIPEIDLLLRANLPKQFVLLNLKQIDEKTMLLDGRDQKTTLQLEVKVFFDGVQFVVREVKIKEHKALQDFVNPLLKLESYSLLKMLNLLEENINIASESAPPLFDLCKLLHSKYEKNISSCSPELLKIQKNWEKESESWVLYTFELKNDVITKIKVSDPQLELELLKVLDFTKFRKDSTLLTIEEVLSFVPEKQVSEFGLKEQLLVNDRFNKYLQIKPTKVDIKGGEVKVFFEVGGIKFIGNYDVVTDVLAPIALDFGEVRSPLVFQRFQLVFKEDQQEYLTKFLLDPVEYLRAINPKLVDRYFNDGKLVVEKQQKTE